jgi:hypothetical protein
MAHGLLLLLLLQLAARNHLRQLQRLLALPILPPPLLLLLLLLRYGGSIVSNSPLSSSPSALGRTARPTPTPTQHAGEPPHAATTTTPHGGGQAGEVAAALHGLHHLLEPAHPANLLQHGGVRRRQRLRDRITAASATRQSLVGWRIDA